MLSHRFGAKMCCCIVRQLCLKLCKESLLTFKVFLGGSGKQAKQVCPSRPCLSSLAALAQ